MLECTASPTELQVLLCTFALVSSAQHVRGHDHDPGGWEECGGGPGDPCGHLPLPASAWIFVDPGSPWAVQPVVAGLRALRPGGLGYTRDTPKTC